MAYFNINWKQYGPSTKQPTPTSSVKSVQPAIAKPTVPPLSPTPTPGPMVEPTKTFSQTPSVGEGTSRGKIFSGNLLGDVFDALLTPVYGYSGFLKSGYEEKKRQQVAGEVKPAGPGGKFADLGSVAKRFKESFKGIIPGIQNRVMPGDQPGDVNVAEELKIKNPLAQKAYNTALSFAVPSIPVGKLLSGTGKVVKAIPGVQKGLELAGKVGGKVSQFAKETPFVYKAVEKFNPYFRHPEIGKMVEESGQAAQGQLNNLYRVLDNAVQGLTPAEQARVGQILEGGITADKKLSKIAEPIRQIAQKIGQEAVDMGLLDPKSFEKYKGKYLGHIFEDYLTNSGFSYGIKKQMPGIVGTSFKFRKGAEDYIRQFAPAQFYRLGNTLKDIETAKLYKGLASKYGVVADAIKKGRKIVGRNMPKGYVYAPEVIGNSKIAKMFKNLAVPQSVAEYMQNIRQVTPTTSWDKALGAWKAGKTIWNPAYHFRNLLSNQILSDMSTGRGLVRTVVDYVGAVRNYFGKGNQAFVKVAEESGLIRNKNFGATLNEFLDIAKIAEKSGMKKVSEIPSKIQNITEETAKLNVFKSWIEKFADDMGKTVEQVLKDPQVVNQAKNAAEEAIFSPYRIGATERQLASRLIPFYSFTRQVIPFTAKTLLKHPERIAKYGRFKQAVENLTPGGVPDEDRLDYYQNQVRLPFKDSQGRDTYFDPTYIYPFGSAIDTGFERGKLPFGFSFDPRFSFVSKALFNYDPYLQKQVSTSNIPSRATGQKVDALLREVSPSFVSNLRSKLIPALSEESDKAGRFRSKPQAILDTLFGIRTSSMGEGEMRSRKEMEDVNSLRSIQKEEQDIMTDPSLSPAEKAKMVRELRGVYQSR